ncbi:tryptophan synthase subunit alpha [Alcaligenes sp. Marseille-Q7550]
MSSNVRLKAAFERLNGRCALVPYVTAGDPSVPSTVALMHALRQAGADVIELGVPFSDPTADGPVIQRAAERAISRGVGLRKVLDIVRQFRQLDDETPVVLMGYANPIECIGQAEFARLAGQSGVDGVLTVDYPPEESQEFTALLTEQGVDTIFLLSPTSTDERIAKVAALAQGYVYYVSLKGVTGSGQIDVADVEHHLQRIRKHVKIPVGVGFGIRDAQSAKAISRNADAVVIGSKLIETMEEAVQAHAGKDQKDVDAAAIAAAGQWLGQIRQALDN